MRFVACGRRSSDFGRHDDQRALLGDARLAAQQVEVLRRRRQVRHADVALGGELQEALEAGAGVLRARALVAVRQQQRQARGLAPLGQAGDDELVDDHLRAVDEVAELRLPEDERLGRLGRVAVLEARGSRSRSAASCAARTARARRAASGSGRSSGRSWRRAGRGGAGRTCRARRPGRSGASGCPRSAARRRRAARRAPSRSRRRRRAPRAGARAA